MGKENEQADSKVNLVIKKIKDGKVGTGPLLDLAEAVANGLSKKVAETAKDAPLSDDS